MTTNYYDAPTTAQATKLTEIFRDQTISRLVWWGVEKVDKGDIMGLTNGVWTKGRFSEYIQAALDDNEAAEKLIIWQLGKDFIRAHTPNATK